MSVTGFERHSTAAIRAGLSRSTMLNWCCGALALLAFSAAFLTLPYRNLDGIAQLERLAPQIEGAKLLSPESKEAIGRLVMRQSVLTGSANETVESRRKIAIERVKNAIQAKQVASASGEPAKP